MIDGISGAPLPEGFPFKGLIEAACITYDFFPCVVGAIKINETGLGTNPACTQDGTDASGCFPDGTQGGVGILQLTSSFPSNWADPGASIDYAIAHFLVPAYEAWRAEPYNLTGDDLVRGIAAAYNEGLGTAEIDHEKYGNVDYGTTNEYAERALQHYLALVRGTIPT